MTDNKNKDINQDFVPMDEQKQQDIASKGGKSQSQENNPAGFANDPGITSEASQEGESE